MRIQVLSKLTLRLPTPAAQNIIYVIIEGQITMTITDTKSQVHFGVHPEQLRIQNVDFGKVLRNGYGTLMYPPTKPLVPHPEQHSTTSNSVVVILQIAEIKTPRSRNTYLVYPSMSCGALPETFPKIPKMVATDTIRSTHKLSLIFWGYTLATYSSTTQLCKVTTDYR